jgi:hypothetical protein
MPNYNKVTLPKQMSTQDIVKNSQEMKGAGIGWQQTYVGIHKLLESNEFRILRAGNTLFLIRILNPQEAAMFVFDADTPRHFLRNFKEFMQAMQKCGYKRVSGITGNTQIFEMVRKAGFPIVVEPTGQESGGKKLYKGTVDIRESN